MQKRSLTLSLLLVLVPALVLGTGAAAQPGGGAPPKQVVTQLLTAVGPVSLITTIPTPDAPLTSFDASWVDPISQLYYLADRSNASVDVFDADANTFVKRIKAGFKGFTGSGSTSGPNGVLVSANWLFVTDAPSRVVSIDLTTDQVVGFVSTAGASGLRADGLAYDEADGLLLAVNSSDTPPFATLIQVNASTGALTVLKKIVFTTATAGAGAAVYNPTTGFFYVAIPEVSGPGGTGPNGAVAPINFDGTLNPLFTVPRCQPAGIALDSAKQNLLVSCGVVFDTAGLAWNAAGTSSAAPISVLLEAGTGAIIKNIEGTGGSDQVWFNPVDQHYYVASANQPGGPVLGVIGSITQSLSQLVPTVNKSPGTAHSVAVNPLNNKIFVPLPANNVAPDCLNGCVAVYGRRPSIQD